MLALSNNPNNQTPSYAIFKGSRKYELRASSRYTDMNPFVTQTKKCHIKHNFLLLSSVIALNLNSIVVSV